MLLTVTKLKTFHVTLQEKLLDKVELKSKERNSYVIGCPVMMVAPNLDSF